MLNLINPEVKHLNQHLWTKAQMCVSFVVGFFFFFEKKLWLKIKDYNWKDENSGV